MLDVPGPISKNTVSYSDDGLKNLLHINISREIDVITHIAFGGEQASWVTRKM